MKYCVVSTFDPKKLRDNRYSLIFGHLRDHGVRVKVLPEVNPKNLEDTLEDYSAAFDKADMVLHLPAFTRQQLLYAYDEDFRKWEKEMEKIGHHWTAAEFDELNKERRKKESEFQQSLEASIRGLRERKIVIDADVFMENIDATYRLLNKNHLPHESRMSVREWEANKFFPAVFKMHHTSGGHGIYFIENDDQFRKMFDKEYIVREDQFGSGRFSDSRDYFDVTRFIQCPSDHFTHYRVFTLGDRSVLGAALSYSQSRKSDDERIAYDDTFIRNVFDDIKSPIFLNRRKIVSNKRSGGTQIPLDPNKSSRHITPYEKAILRAHGIIKQKAPDRLLGLACDTARILGERGLYVIGQDWIQEDKTGNFYCLEVNQGPDLYIFGTLYNRGEDDKEESWRIGSEKIAEGILRHLRGIR